MNRLDNPVDSGVAADGLVLGVNQNDLKVFVRGVLVDPVRIEDPQVGAATANPLFGGGFERALVFQLIDSLICGLACGVEHVSRFGGLLQNIGYRGRTIGRAFGDWPLPTSSTDTDTIDNIALLGLVAQTASFVRSRRARGTMNDVQLAKLY